jgi:hypothetical protein
VVVERKVRDAAVEALRRVRALRAQVVKFVVVLLAFFFSNNAGTTSRAHKKMSVCVCESERGKQTKGGEGRAAAAAAAHTHGECTWPPDRKQRRH